MLGLIIGAVVLTSDGHGRRGGKRRGDGGHKNKQISDQDEAWKILTGELPMSPEISTKWGLKAHQVTNQERSRLDEKELEWSDELHTIAY